MHKLTIHQELGDTLGSIGVKIHAALADAHLLQAMAAFGEEMDRCSDKVSMFKVMCKYADILPPVEA
jgi:biotin carboxylase